MIACRCRECCGKQSKQRISFPPATLPVSANRNRNTSLLRTQKSPLTFLVASYSYSHFIHHYKVRIQHHSSTSPSSAADSGLLATFVSPLSFLLPPRFLFPNATCSNRGMKRPSSHISLLHSTTLLPALPPPPTFLPCLFSHPARPLTLLLLLDLCVCVCMFVRVLNHVFAVVIESQEVRQ